MNKLFYAQQLQDLLYPTPTADAKMDEQVALAAISQARDEVIKLQVLQAKGETNFIPYNWLSSFVDDDAIEIQKNKYGKYYVDLPVRPMPIMGKEDGVRQVWLQGKEDQLLKPVSGAFKGMFANQPARRLEGRMGYYLEGGKRIYFIQDMEEGCKVEMRILAQSYDLDEYDEFPCDDSLVPTIMQRAVELYSIQKNIPADKINDGISN